jgi:hypothetical protein
MIQFDEAKEVYLSRYSYGASTGVSFPYRHGIDFVIADIPVDLITCWPRDRSVVDKIVEFMKTTDLDGVWLIYGRDFEDMPFTPFWNRKFQVMDGNHRVESAKILGKKTIKAYLPVEHYSFWKSEEKPCIPSVS